MWANHQFRVPSMFCDLKPYPEVRVRNPYTFRTRTHVRVRERNVNGFDFQIEYGNGIDTGCFQKLGTGTERRRIFFKMVVRIRNLVRMWDVSQNLVRVRVFRRK